MLEFELLFEMRLPLVLVSQIRLYCCVHVYWQKSFTYARNLGEFIKGADEHTANRRLRMLTWLLKREIILCLHTYIFLVIPEQHKQSHRDSRSNDASESSDTITTVDSRAGGSPMMAMPSTPPRSDRPPVSAVSPRVLSRLKTSFAEPIVAEYQQSEALTFTSSLNLEPLVRLQEEDEKVIPHTLSSEAAVNPHDVQVCSKHAALYHSFHSSVY